MYYCTYCGDHKYLNTYKRDSTGQGCPCRFCNKGEYVEWIKLNNNKRGYRVVYEGEEVFRGSLDDCRYYVYLKDQKNPHCRSDFKISEV